MPTTYSIKLPWPTPGLFPNKKLNRWDKAQEKKKQRSDSFYLTKHQIKLYTWAGGRVPLSIMFYPPHSGYDLDNCLAALKSAIDGMADGMKVNDRMFRPITIDFGEVVPGGEVVVEFTA